MNVDSEMNRLMTLLSDIEGKQASCLHAFMGKWPFKGEPEMVCPKCWFARPMTPAEVEERWKP